MNKNLIEWHEWDNELFEKARQQEKAILLWIGNNGCYWCEQMIKESFQNEEITSRINDNFIAVKVDSYVRPDIGRYFHGVFTQMTGREASYPLTIFLSPDMVPLYTASYVPDRNRDGMMGMDETTELISEKYKNQKKILIKKGREVLNELTNSSDTLKATKLNSNLSVLISEQILALYDKENSGFGDSPKFPRYSVLQLSMDVYELEKNEKIAAIVQNTLDSMILKNLRDTEDGGFHRYCTDSAWAEPYRGKSIFDNALMAEVLFRAYGLLGESLYLDTAIETVEFICLNFKDSESLDENMFSQLYDEGKIKDKNIITSSNTMAINALFCAGEHDSKYNKIAISSLSKLLETSMQNGKLYHASKPLVEGFLEDYAYLASALISAHERTREEHYLVKASEIINEALRRYFNGGIWKYTNREFELFADTVDGDYPAALSVMAQVLQKAGQTISSDYDKFLNRTLEIHSYTLMRQPISMPQLSRVALKSVQHPAKV